MKIGNRVRFLDHEGGGTIVDVAKGRYVVEDEDGFQWTMAERELVVDEMDEAMEIVLLNRSLKKARQKSDELAKSKGVKMGRKERGERVVDLHQEALFGRGRYMDSADIHEMQKQKIISVLNEEKGRHGRQIIFVHGKGSGVLRRELIEILEKNKTFCRYEDASFQKYGFQGAIKVIIT